MQCKAVEIKQHSQVIYLDKVMSEEPLALKAIIKYLEN